jgi:hypothetical protein
MDMETTTKAARDRLQGKAATRYRAAAVAMSAAAGVAVVVYRTLREPAQ